MQDHIAQQIETALLNTVTALQRIAHALESLAHSSNPAFKTEEEQDQAKAWPWPKQQG